MQNSSDLVHFEMSIQFFFCFFFAQQKIFFVSKVKMTPFSILYREKKTFLVDDSPSTEYAMYIDKERPCKVGWAFLPSEVI